MTFRLLPSTPSRPPSKRLGAWSLALAAILPLASSCASDGGDANTDSSPGGRSGATPDDGLGGIGGEDLGTLDLAQTFEKGAYGRFVDRARASGATFWSDRASWNGNDPPAAGTDATIPAGKTVILDRSVKLRSLSVDGTLLCADRDLRVTVGSVMVHGTFRCGAADAPYEKRLTLTLDGADGDAGPMDMGKKVVGAMGRGALEFHGLPRSSWTRLRATAAKGATSIELAAEVDWRKGDRIVLASTDFDMNQAEERTITAVSGRTVSFAEPLQFMHFGKKLSYRNQALGQEFAVDQRGEVALLNRNIVIEGDEASEADRVGAHVMVMKGSSMRISNVELRRVGHISKIGRYPLHWHLARDVSGQYIQNSSVHHSYNRCITIHGTNNARVSNNVCYDHIGHGYFFEDGSETGNVLTGNLGLVTRKPVTDLTKNPPWTPILESDVDVRGTDALGPATYWVINPDNTLRGNVAAGSDGSGFWYGIASGPTGPSGDDPDVKDIQPNKTPLKEFRSNSVHSTAGMAVIFGASPDPKGSGYSPPSVAVLEKVTTYKTRARGLWTHVGRIDVDGLYSSDNVRGAFFSFTTHLRNALIVGESENVGTPVTPLEKNLGRSLASPKGNVAGYILYDGPARFENVLFAGFDRDAENVYVFGNNGAGTQHMNNKFENIGIDPSTRRVFPTAAQQGFSNNNGERHGSFIDLDGSVSGHPGNYVLPNFPMNTNANCESGPWTSPDWTSCANTYGVLEMYNARYDDATNDKRSPLEIERTGNGQRPTWQLGGGRREYDQVGTTKYFEWEYEMGAIVDQNYTYRWKFTGLPFPRTANVRLIDLDNGARVVLELVGAPAGVRVLGGDRTGATSLSALRSARSSTWFRSGTSLYLLVVSGTLLKLER